MMKKLFSAIMAAVLLSGMIVWAKEETKRTDIQTNSAEMMSEEQIQLPSPEGLKWALQSLSQKR